MVRKLPLIALIALFFLTGCLDDNVEINRQIYTPEEFAVLERHLDLPADQYDYSVELPDHLQSFNAIEPDISDEMATLGRVLFYDRNLSRTNAVSCASCHEQKLAFSDDVAFSEGFDGELTKRNSLALAAVTNFETDYGGSSFSGAGFFWDERAHSIGEQTEMTIQDPIEMGMNFGDLEVKLQQLPYYPILFRKAFGDSGISKNRIIEALEAFMNSFISVDSRFDQAASKVADGGFARRFPDFSEMENLGRRLYMDHCTTCHSPNMSTLMVTVANNGLDVKYEDNGLGDHRNNPSLDGVFKVPFLRNVALTAPYMHDGRFAILEEVVEHYSSGIKNHPNLDFRLRKINGAPRHMNFTEEEKMALVAFLETLTDETFIAEERFSDPFK